MSRRVLLILLLLPAVLPPGARALDGYRYFEGTAATVNKEVLFVSDVLREQCFLRCAALPGSPAEELSPEEARERLIGETLALQEQGKLELGQVDAAELADRVREAQSRMDGCVSPCREEVSPPDVGKWVERKLLVRDFLRRRVGAFIEVKDDDVRRVIGDRSASGDAGALQDERKVREELQEEKYSKEVRNWYARAASKASITLSPMEGK